MTVSKLNMSKWLTVTVGAALTLTACGPGDDGADAADESPATEDQQTETTEDDDSDSTGSEDEAGGDASGDSDDETPDEESTGDELQAKYLLLVGEDVDHSEAEGDLEATVHDGMAPFSAFERHMPFLEGEDEWSARGPFRP